MRVLAMAIVLLPYLRGAPRLLEHMMRIDLDATCKE